MTTLKFLLIGDVHFPDSHDFDQVDLKDSGFSEQAAKLLNCSVFTTVDRGLREYLESQRVDSILICGDLTTKGDLASYDKCVERLLSIFNQFKYSADKIHFTPGNHDISRSLAKIGVDNKFAPLIASWKSRSFDIFPHPSLRNVEIKEGDIDRCRIYSLNSCYGCGESRGFPASIRAEMERVLSEFEKKSTPADSFTLLQEQLDCPLFDESHISEVCRLIFPRFHGPVV